MGWESYFTVSTGSKAASSNRIFNIFQIQYERGGTADTAISVLKAEGLSYRRQDMLHDFRAYGSIANTAVWKTESRERALDFFENVVEPYRQEEGITVKKAWENIRRYSKGEFTDEQDEIDLTGAAGQYHFY